MNMYKRILLAYDGSVEGRTALREGALLAKQCGAEVFLLSVLTDTGTLLLSEVTLAGATVQMEEDFREIIDEGVARLRKLGFDPVAELVRGQPAEEIGKFAKQVGADLIVMGHRRQSAFDRWWSGPKGAYLMDYTDCSLLVRAMRLVTKPSKRCFPNSDWIRIDHGRDREPRRIRKQPPGPWAGRAGHLLRGRHYGHAGRPDVPGSREVRPPSGQGRWSSRK